MSGAQPEQEKQQPPASAMTEAGFSMNVKMIDEHGQEVMLTFRCPRASDSAKLIGHYNTTIKDLLQWGWQVVGGRSQANGAADSATPMCRVHNAPMKPSTKGTGFYCSKKVGDGYCREKVG